MEERFLNEILFGLNTEQKQAVLHSHEKSYQLLILAGAGSGKTSVLTKRIQYRIACGVDPKSILALTFTAAAAFEMRERVEKLFPNSGVRLCTFHSFALYLLRQKYGDKFGYEMLGFSRAPIPKEYSTNEFFCELAEAKISPGTIEREELFNTALPKKIYKKLEPYRQKVLASGTVVFEDLIYGAITLLENFEEAKEIIRERFQEILVDEYQDINPSGYRLVRAVLGMRKSLFVVGDDDQAIYGFRGADIGNIVRFQKDFPMCTVIKLEWNYRSVPEVLHLANGIFRNKLVNLMKTLRAGNTRQDEIFKENRRVCLWESKDPVEEIHRIVLSIKELKTLYGLNYSDFAILVRYNRQREYYERALYEKGILTDKDSLDGVKKEKKVHVLTVHGSKGLQYPVVFYAGLAEGLTPGACKGNKKERKRLLEEERRLFYVGVTRAESCLYLLYCKKRFWKGFETKFKPSRFLQCFKTPVEDSKLPVFLFKIKCVVQALAYMGFGILQITGLRIIRYKNIDAWCNRRVQEFSAFCMRIFHVNLTIENQALLSKVDWSRPVVVVSNHQSYLDIPTIFLGLERTVGFLAKFELSRIPFLRFWMKRIGCVLVKRDTKGGGTNAQQELLQSTTPCINVFPEGTREKSTKLLPFKSGGFRLAAEWRATVLPIVIHGTRDAWESRSDSKAKNVSIRILEPMDLKRIEEERGSVEIRSFLIPEIRQRMESNF